MNPFVRKEIFKAQERKFNEHQRNPSAGNLISIDINNQYFKTTNMSQSLMTVPQAQIRPGIPIKKEVMQFEPGPDETSSEEGYLAKTKRKKSTTKFVTRSASVDIYK